MYTGNHKEDRQKAIEWAKACLELTNLIVIDTETTGLDSDAEAVQIGIVGRTGKVLLDCLLNPGIDIPKEASRIHGINDEDVSIALTFPAIARVLDVLLYEKNVLCYNGSFDYRILQQSARLWSIGIDIEPFTDVMKHFAAYYGDWSSYHGNYRWQKLTVAAQCLGISTSGAHGATADALMTLRVVEAMAKS